MKKLFLFLAIFAAISIFSKVRSQQQDSTINLALLPDAVVSGSVVNGRGAPADILYDPSINDYHVATTFNEYGVSYLVNLGTPDADNGFYWKVDWASEKNINYITFGGVYSNQPQPNTLWRISYLSGTTWTTLEEGVGGWIDGGIYEWDNTLGQPISASSIRVQVYSDGTNDLVSIHLRARGGISNNEDDSSTLLKACLIQLLPYDSEPNNNGSSVWNTSGNNIDYTAGNVGIGTTNIGTWKLAVGGKIRAEEVKVETNWADYVFAEGYDLPTLEEVEKHIQEKGHLINIPSAPEVEANGIELGEMNKLLLEKIEELTLYILKMDKEIQALKNKSDHKPTE